MPALFHTIDGRDPELLDLTLGEIGIPPWDVLAAEPAWKSDSTSFDGDRTLVLGPLLTTASRPMIYERAASRHNRCDLMTDARSKPEELDRRSLAGAREPDARGISGRPERRLCGSSSRPLVHAALWKHAALDTTVEICGVLVGSWHRDDAGPFVKIVESIRGEGAETKFAEVTFTHQTWAKINGEMDTEVRQVVDRRLVSYASGLRHFPVRPRSFHPRAFLFRPGPGRPRHRSDPQDRRSLHLAGWEAEPVRAFLGRRPHPGWIARRLRAAGRTRDLAARTARGGSPAGNANSRRQAAEPRTR